MITAKNLVMKFDSFIALNDLNCNIPDGCIYGLVGSNGAGKSTFLRLAAGVYCPSSGDILYDGIAVYDNPAVKRKFVYVPDDLFFLPQSNMDRMAELYEACYESFDRNRFDELIQIFLLDAKAKFNTFSKGMRRQAATILALSCKTDYIFFDETFDGLDPVMRNLVKSILYQDVYERNATAVITSHSLRELEDTCDQLALLHKGGIILENDVQNLKTSLFKIQVAFNHTFNPTIFKNIDALNISIQGSVARIIIRGDKDEVSAKINSLNPLLFEILPLSLEEVFLYEMDALGYKFQLDER